MDSIDKLLAEVKTEHTETKNTPPQANLNPVKVVLSTNKSDLLIDKLLSDVQADFSEAKTEYTQSNSRNNLPQIQLNSPPPKSDGFIDIENLELVCSSGLDCYYTPSKIARLTYAKPGNIAASI